jgi:hypothetical protein
MLTQASVFTIVSRTDHLYYWYSYLIVWLGGKRENDTHQIESPWPGIGFFYTTPKNDFRSVEFCRNHVLCSFVDRSFHSVVVHTVGTTVS